MEITTQTKQIAISAIYSAFITVTIQSEFSGTILQRKAVSENNGHFLRPMLSYKYIYTP